MTNKLNHFGLAAIVLAIGLPAWAQDSADRELDESLRRAYDDRDHQDPIPDYAEHEIEKEQDQFQITLRLQAGLQAAFLEDLEIVNRKGSSGGETLALQDSEFRDFEFDGTLGVLPVVEFNLGGYLAIRASAFGAAWSEDENVMEPGDSFTFGNTTFSTGDTVESEYGLFMGDVAIGGHVVQNRHIRLGLYGGARYIAWESTLERRGGASLYSKEESRVEAVVPTFALSLDLAPAPWFEFYLNGQAGWFGYESDDEELVVINGRPQRIADKHRETTTLEAESGLRLIFGGHFGVYLGYRVHYLEIERETPGEKEGARTFVHGPVAGLLIQF